LEDLGSTNGTFINGQPLSGPHALHIGEAITFGERINVVFDIEDIPDDSTVVSHLPQQMERQYPAAQNSSPSYPVQTPAVQQQSPRPVQQPLQTVQPIPPPSVPPSYPPQNSYQSPPQKPPNRNVTMIIILVVVLLLVVCACISLGLYFAPKEFWCLFPVWPAGSCP
jgi:hypothetical protein